MATGMAVKMLNSTPTPPESTDASAPHTQLVQTQIPFDVHVSTPPTTEESAWPGLPPPTRQMPLTHYFANADAGSGGNDASAS